MKCPECNGRGYFYFPKYAALPGKCEDCKGTGVVEDNYSDRFLTEEEKNINLNIRRK